MARDMISAPADELAYEQALIRSRWIEELRRQGHRKCTGDLFDGRGGVCALGLLAEVAGMERTNSAYGEILAGLLTHSQLDDVWRMNDGWEDPLGSYSIRQHTFAEIADVAEAWFK